MNATESQNYRPGFYLRILGTAILMMAIADFLIQGLHGLTPDYRYWIMPGFSVLLAVCGLLCGYLWREDKGARLFFALAAALVPVQFSQIGAMLHVFWHGAEPGFTSWFGVDSLLRPALLGANLALSLAVALPIAYLAFSMLAKPRRSSLLAELFLGCVLFLIPVRDANMAAVLFVALFVILHGVQSRQRENALMLSLEGVAAQVLVFLPLTILIGRSVLLPWSWLTSAGLWFILAVLLFADAARLGREGSWAKWAEPLGALAAALSARYLILELTPEWLAGPGQTMLSFLVSVGVLFQLGERARFNGSAYRTLGSVLALLGCLLYFAARHDHSAALLFLGIGVVLVYSGIVHRQRWILFSGIVGFLVGMIFYAKFTFSLYQASPWLSMTGLGIAILLFASFLEKKRKPLMAMGRHWMETVRAWER